MILKRADFPQATAGRRVSTPTITITDGGQLRFSTILTTEAVKDSTHVLLDWNPETKIFRAKPMSEVPKGAKYTMDDLFALSRPTVKEGEKKSIQAYLGVSSIFGHASGIPYDYKKSGTQVFPATTDDKGWISITLDKEVLPKREVATRAKRTPAEPAKATEAAKTAETSVDDID